MNTSLTIAQLENQLLASKNVFDISVTQNRSLSLTEKQALWTRFLADQHAAAAMLMKGYAHRDQITRQLAQRIDMHQQMHDVAKRGAA